MLRVRLALTSEADEASALLVELPRFVIVPSSGPSLRHDLSFVSEQFSCRVQCGAVLGMSVCCIRVDHDQLRVLLRLASKGGRSYGAAGIPSNTQPVQLSCCYESALSLRERSRFSDGSQVTLFRGLRLGLI